MPKSAFLRDLFIKHFIAKAFRWEPDVLDRITADELDALVYIESEINNRQHEEMEKEKRKAHKNG